MVSTIGIHGDSPCSNDAFSSAIGLAGGRNAMTIAIAQTTGGTIHTMLSLVELGDVP
jgi:hypothetical protein